MDATRASDVDERVNINPDLYVVIPTAGRSALFERTLSSLAQCQQPPAYRGAIVVENGPKADAEEISSRYQASLNARYIYQAKANKSHALNVALENLPDCLSVFIDDDIRLHTQTLRAYADMASRCGRGHFFGGPVRIDYQQAPPAWLMKYLPASVTGWIHDQDYLPVDEGWPRFLGCNWAAFSDDIRACGGFDPDYGPGSRTGSTGQETNVQNRLIAHGFMGRYVPLAEVWHYVPQARCSPGWALRRGYSRGVEIGTRGEPQRLDLWGHSRGMVKEVLKKSWSAARVSLPGHPPEVRYDAYYQLFSYWGFMRSIERISASTSHRTTEP